MKRNEFEQEAYDMGFNDSKSGTPYRADELYPPSGHERDTTFTDDLNYFYFKGYYDYPEDIDE